MAPVRVMAKQEVILSAEVSKSLRLHNPEVL
jgi:hypothetical protein